MKDKCDEAIQAYALEHKSSSRAVSHDSPHQVTKKDPYEEDELALLGGHTRLIKPIKTSESPAPMLGPSLTYSPAVRNPSPGTTDSGSLSDSCAYMADQSPQWSQIQSSLIDHRFPPNGHDRLSPHSMENGDRPFSSAGSPSSGSGMSPMPNGLAFQSDPLQLSSKLPQDISQDYNYRGIPGYNAGQPASVPNINGDFVQIVNPHQAGAPQVNYEPMDVAPDRGAGWNFLDDWYGHVLTLDVIPPGYGG